MKTDRIKVSMEFNIMGSGLWLTAECPIAPDEDVVEEFKKQRSLLLKSFETLTGSYYSSIPGHPEQELKVSQVDKRVETIIKDINDCIAIDDKTGLGVQIGLIAYKDAAGSDPRIQQAYLEKLKELGG